MTKFSIIFVLSLPFSEYLNYNFDFQFAFSFDYIEFILMIWI